MRIKAMFIAVPGIFALTVLAVSLLGDAKSQKETINLTEDLKVGGVTLIAGKYLIVHREHETNEAGEACLFFYRPASRSEKNEVAKFHCRPVSGEPTEGCKMRASRQPDGTLVLKSLQFPGSRDIHELESSN